MSIEELTALADRCEAATGPDRELDWAIRQAAGDWAIPFDARPDDYLTPIGGKMVQVRRVGIGGCSGDRFCPRYTDSLDAAMTLVPDDEATSALNEAMGSLSVDGWPDGGYVSKLARYVCAAALRARA